MGLRSLGFLEIPWAVGGAGTPHSVSAGAGPWRGVWPWLGVRRGPPSTFERTADMLEHGYVAKPVLGRCGQNVLLFAEGRPSAPWGPVIRLRHPMDMTAFPIRSLNNPSQFDGTRCAVCARFHTYQLSRFFVGVMVMPG